MEYNLCQQAYVLSMKSNWLAFLNGNQPNTKEQLEKTLHEHLIHFLPSSKAYMGTWEIVWGPVVFSLMGIPDNVVYVARKTSDPLVYVVAVAGTNDASTFGKTDEDGQVSTTITWKQAFLEDMDGNSLLEPYENPDPSCPNPCLSAGTALGVRFLLRACPNQKTNPNDNNPVRLLNYLKNLENEQDSSKATLIIAGHSLGGALAPTLALALFNPNGGPLNQHNWGNVYVLPTAGATPGNGDFSKSFQSVFPGVPPNVDSTQDQPLDLSKEPNPSTTEMWNRNIANNYDIVPMAWLPDEMDNIPPKLTGKGGIYARLKWDKPKEQKLALRKMIKAAQNKPKPPENYPPYGGSSVAGSYAALPRLWFACIELIYTHPDDLDPNHTDPISKLPGDYLKHWRVQHSMAYSEQIFNIDRTVLDLVPKPGNEALSSMGTSLFEASAAKIDVETDETELTRD